jgi:hypothetical protein
MARSPFRARFMAGRESDLVRSLDDAVDAIEDSDIL